jgi:hypothetical protein
LEFFYQQTQIRHNRLGTYPRQHFRDDRASAEVHKFQRRLSAIDAEIASREPKRLLPYPWLRPTLIAASIHM